MKLTDDALATLIPPLPRDAHKHMLGHVGLIAGSGDMPGAAVLMARAATRSGCGLFTLYAAPGTTAQIPPEVMINRRGEVDFPTFCRGKTAIGMGPGLGLGNADHMLPSLLGTFPGPLLLDADALTALARHAAMWSRAAGRCIVTPHAGEMARLTGLTATEVTEQAQTLAAQCAVAWNAVVVLKGATTHIAAPDGQTATFDGGTPGMATAGSGDVLSGLCAGLLAAGLDPYAAARAAVLIHGQAGCTAAAKHGERAMRAGDIAGEIKF